MAVIGISSQSQGEATSLSPRFTLAEEAAPQAPSVAGIERKHNLPIRLTRLIGRADTVSRLVEQLPRHRLVTIVGPGGIGKTSVALAVAKELIATYKHGVWLTDPAALADPRWCRPRLLPRSGSRSATKIRFPA